MATGKKQAAGLSKFLSLVLRHKPEEIGLVLDAQGWASVDDLLEKAAAHGTVFTRDDLGHVVATSEKKRFSLSEDGRRIRAAQGHSVEVDLGLVPVVPPDVLYHGTAGRFLEAILAEGLKPGARQYVHLSPDVQTARAVGMRHGSPVILRVAAGALNRAGHPFFQAENGVWLTGPVPASFLERVA
ncbi:RNA 2'-phosphotransferase [Zavarzinia sp. CC-PAN008]|uniref:RNA 2'-phosphotransferase n=1 Tax=Zavarzinia sp. CC-PAN008 TaxID=3243332 RepID=UPI003F749BA9